MEKIGELNYKLDVPTRLRPHTVLYVDMLKRLRDFTEDHCPSPQSVDCRERKLMAPKSLQSRRIAHVESLHSDVFVRRRPTLGVDSCPELLEHLAQRRIRS